MAGSIGNKNAAGSIYNMEEEIKALDEWSQKDDATALVQYCVERDIYAQRVYEWRDQNKSYAEMLKKAKMRIAARLRSKLHDKENPYNYGLFQRDIAFHDAFTHDHEEAIKDREAVRRAEANKSDARASEEERIRVLDEVQRKKRKPK